MLQWGHDKTFCSQVQNDGFKKLVHFDINGENVVSQCRNDKTFSSRAENTLFHKLVHSSKNC